jgi:hypothetical protein
VEERKIKSIFFFFLLFEVTLPAQGYRFTDLRFEEHSEEFALFILVLQLGVPLCQTVTICYAFFVVEELKMDQ